MTLLLFGPQTGVQTYRVSSAHDSGLTTASLAYIETAYNAIQWQYVSGKFRETFLSLYGQPGESVLSLALYAGLSTLRLPACRKFPDDEAGIRKVQDITKNYDDALALARAYPHLDPNGLNKMISKRAEKKEKEKDTLSVDCPTCNENLCVLAEHCPFSHHVNSTLVCRISGAIMDSSNPPMAFPNGYVYSYNALSEMAKANFDVVTCPRTKETCSFSRLRKVYIS